MSRLLSPSPEGSADLGGEGGGGVHHRHAANFVQSAQKRELTVGNSGARTHMPSHPGRSERTLSRQKLAQRKLAAQGFTMLPDFLRQKAEKAEREARLAALVAAALAAATAARPRSTQQNPFVLEEEETSEDEVMANTGNPKTKSVFHTHERTPETSVTSDRVQHRGLDGASTPCVIENTSEPIPVKDTKEDQSKPSGTVSGFSS